MSLPSIRKTQMLASNISWNGWWYIYMISLEKRG